MASPASQSIDALIEPLLPHLRRFAFGLCRNPEDADDLVQDCVARAIGRWHLRRHDGNLKGWLFAILYNEFVNGRRRIARRSAIASLREAEDEPQAAAAQEDHLYLRDVMGAIARLPEDQRTVLLLIAVEDLSYAETAEALGVPLGTIMSRLSRAREKLRRLLDGAGP